MHNNNGVQNGHFQENGVDMNGFSNGVHENGVSAIPQYK